MKRVSIFFIGIILIAFIVRIWNIANNPPALSWDEVSIGYNAYTISTTGRDEHGRWFPLDTFIAYGDYKPPIPIYLTVPFVAVFGLTEVAVRLPVVIISTLTVGLLFFVAKELFITHRSSLRIALFSQALIAVSPWHINLSRAGFESTIGLFFTTLGVYLFLLARRLPRLYVVCLIPFVASVYTFNSSRYVSLFLVPFLMILNWRLIWEKRQLVGLGIVIGVICLLPIASHLQSAEARLRFQEVSIFSDPAIVSTANQRIEMLGNTTFAHLIANRRIGYLLSFAKHFLDHFDPKFLFISGDGNPKFSTQDVGQLYIIEIVTLVVGIVSIYAWSGRIFTLLIGWLIISLVPASVARETPHALRILSTLPVFILVSAFGIVRLWSGDGWKRLVFILIFVGLTLNIGYYLYSYHSHYPVTYSGEWQYGYKQAITYTESVKEQYEHIVLTESIGRAYMYTAFYGAYPLQTILDSDMRYFESVGFYTVEGFDKYRFVKVSPQEFKTNTLYVLSPGVVPEGAQILKQIHLLNGHEILTIFHI